MDIEIQKFFDERIKKKIKHGSQNIPDEQMPDFENKIRENFVLETWLPIAAEKAKFVTLRTHSGKMTHPSARTSSFVAKKPQENDGYLRTGNVSVETDMCGGGAASLIYYAFMNLKLTDGQTILSHLQKSTDYIKQQFDIPTMSFDDIQKGFLAVFDETDEDIYTDGLLREVFFPVDDGYHLLSITSPSGIIFAQTDKIDKIRFSEETKEIRKLKRQGKPSDKGFTEFFDLTIANYGGSQPQNIGALNSKYKKVYLLSASPPQFKKRKTKLPKTNFMSILWVKGFQRSFQKFHTQIAIKKQNQHSRLRRDNHIRFIVDQISKQMWAVRQTEPGWSNSDTYRSLPRHQKIWLDQQYAGNRYDNPDWMGKVIADISRWFINSYNTLLGSDAELLDDTDLRHVETIIQECEEAIR